MKKLFILLFSVCAILFTFSCTSRGPVATQPAKVSRQISSTGEAVRTRTARQQAAIAEQVEQLFLSNGYEVVSFKTELAPNEYDTYGAYILKKSDRYVYTILRARDILVETGSNTSVYSGTEAIGTRLLKTPDLGSEFEPASSNPISIHFLAPASADSPQDEHRISVKFVLNSESDLTSLELRYVITDALRSPLIVRLLTEKRTVAEETSRQNNTLCSFVHRSDAGTYKIVVQNSNIPTDDSLPGREDKKVSDWQLSDYAFVHSECLSEND